MHIKLNVKIVWFGEFYIELSIKKQRPAHQTEISNNAQIWKEKVWNVNKVREMEKISIIYNKSEKNWFIEIIVLG